MARDQRQVRLAAKVVLVADDQSVLLFRGGDPSDPSAGTWWFPPGGGVEAGESIADAARREVHEETGLRLVELGPVLARRQVEFSFNGAVVVNDEHYFVVRVDRFDIDSVGWTDVEREVIVESRWWALHELCATQQTVYPEDLLSLVEALV